MLISGHKTRSVFERYNVVSERDLQEAARRLENYIEELKAIEGQPALGTPKGTPAPFRGIRRHFENCKSLNARIHVMRKWRNGQTRQT